MFHADEGRIENLDHLIPRQEPRIVMQQQCASVRIRLESADPQHACQLALHRPAEGTSPLQHQVAQRNRPGSSETHSHPLMKEP